jgi:hypothetical protein
MNDKLGAAATFSSHHTEFEEFPFNRVSGARAFRLRLGSGLDRFR